MRVERSGGFAGMTLRGALDTTTLPPEEAARVAGLLGRVDLGTLASHPQRAGQPDRFQYDLVIERDGERFELRLGERELPGELRQLVDRMLRRG